MTLQVLDSILEAEAKNPEFNVGEPFPYWNHPCRQNHNTMIWFLDDLQDLRDINFNPANRPSGPSFHLHTTQLDHILHKTAGEILIEKGDTDPLSGPVAFSTSIQEY
jgi:hypothetical protein